jgi:hypothetical protein
MHTLPSARPEHHVRVVVLTEETPVRVCGLAVVVATEKRLEKEEINALPENRSEEEEGEREGKLESKGKARVEGVGEGEGVGEVEGVWKEIAPVRLSG